MAKHKFKITKKGIFITAGVLVLFALAGGAGVLLRWTLIQRSNNTSNFQPYSNTKEQPLPRAITDSQNQALSGNADQANQTIQKALTQPNVSDDDRYQLLWQEGVNYSNQNQYQKALDAYLQAEKIKSTFTISHLIGEAYEALGNKTAAIDYYKKAISQIDTNSPSYNIDKKVYQDKIIALGGQP